MSSNAEAWTLLSIGLAVIGVRVYVRWTMVGPRGFQLDDFLMPLAGIIFTLETCAAYLVGALYGGLTNSYMTDEQRASLDPTSAEYSHRQSGSKVQVVGWSFYAATLWLIKFSLAIFYARLTLGLKHMAIRIKIAYVLLGVTWLTTEVFILFGCHPISKNWQISPNPGNFCQPTISRLNVIPLVVFNVVTDLYLLSIPLPMLWTVNVGLKRKISLISLFSGAVFVIAASTVRAVIVLTSGAKGAVASSKWACRETFVSIVVSNLPIIQPLIRATCNRIGLSALFSTTNHTTNVYQLSSGKGLTTNPRTKKSHFTSSKGGSRNWDRESDEHGLVSKTVTADTNDGEIRKIMITSETTVQTESWATLSHAQTANRGAAMRPEWERDVPHIQRPKRSFSTSRSPPSSP